MSTVLTARDLSKAFGPQTVLSGATFTIDDGERIGLVGKNGTGKSTLARIVAGLETADSGNIARRRGAEVAFLEQEPRLNGDSKVIDEVLGGLVRWRDATDRHTKASDALARGDGDLTALVNAQAEAAADVDRLGGWNQEHRAETYLAHLGVLDPQALIGPLSGGEKRRVALAKILVANPDLAILDEPTNHLDVEAVEWLEEHLETEFPGAVWLITHDRYVLDRVVTRTLELEHGKLHSYDGGYGRYLEEKETRMAHEARAESNRQNFLRTEIEWLRRGPKARTTKQKARIDRANAAIAVKGPERSKTAELALDTVRMGKTIVDLRDLSIEVCGRPLIQHLSLNLTEGTRIGIIGRNGAGKTTLIRTILGNLPPSPDIRVTGEIVRGTNTKFTYFDQLRTGLDDSLSILDNVAGGQLRVELAGRVMDSRAYLERFLFDPSKQRQKVGSLSGGERARVALAKHLLVPSNVLVLDEPTNDLDVATLSALEEMLVSFPGCCLLVSHDRFFLDRVATDILAFEGNGQVVHQPGDYSTYRELKTQREAAARASARPPASTTPSAPTSPRAKSTAPSAKEKPVAPVLKALTYGERIELEGLLDKVGAAENRATRAEAALNDPSLYAGAGDDSKNAIAELEAARAEVARLTARWESLEARREGSSTSETKPR
jgi:ATP-binding cassette subfamily F protein uup